MADKPNVSQAIADALKEPSAPAPDPATDGTAAAKAPEAAAAKPVAAPPSTEVGSDVKTDPPTPKVSDEDIVAFKARYGVDLSALPDDDARSKFMSEHSETNKTIGKLQRELAEARKTEEARVPAPAPAPEPQVDVSKLTDQQLAEVMGIDLETSTDPDRDGREIALARKYLEQEERLERLEKTTVESETARIWETTLGALEKEFGPLPDDITRADLVFWASRQGVLDPSAAYWAAVGPARAAAQSLYSEHIIELRTDGKKGATTLRPRTATPVAEAGLESKNVKDAIKEAFGKAKAELGIEGYDS